MESLEQFFFETLHLSNPIVALAVIGFIFILFQQLLKLTSFFMKIGIWVLILIGVYFWWS